MIVIRLDRGALQHLIDTQSEELKLELTKSVLAEASRTLVKGIIPKEAIEIVTTAARVEIREQIGSIKTKDYTRRVVSLSSEMHTAIKKAVEGIAEDTLKEAYDQFHEYADMRAEGYMRGVRKQMTDKFERITWNKIRDEIHETVERRVALLMEGTSEGATCLKS